MFITDRNRFSARIVFAPNTNHGKDGIKNLFNECHRCNHFILLTLMYVPYAEFDVVDEIAFARSLSVPKNSNAKA